MKLLTDLLTNLHQRKNLKMNFSGDKKVLRNVVLKKRLIEENNIGHKDIKPIVIFPGGGQRGVIQAGVTVGLEKLKLIEAFDYVIGVSAGAAAGYYGVAGEAAVGTSIYFEDNVRDHFVNFFRPWKLMDIDDFENTLRNKKSINIDNLRKSRPNLLIGATDRDTGEEVFLDAKKLDDPATALVASVSVPFASSISGGKFVKVNGHDYIDGCVGNPLPISYAIDNLDITDILVVLTTSLSPIKSHAFIQSFLDKTLFKEINPGLRVALEKHNKRYNDELKYLTGEKQFPSHIRIAAIYPEVVPITLVTMDRKVLLECAVKASSYANQLFSKYL